jgi:integrating conjugative element protein (TIGR03755 family)
MSGDDIHVVKNEASICTQSLMTTRNKAMTTTNDNTTYRTTMKRTGQLSMTTRLLYGFLLVTLSVASLNTLAQGSPRPTGSGEWYYVMGGGDPYLGYSQSDRTNIDIGVGARWSLLNACQFDPVASIRDTFEDAQNSLYGLSQQVTSSALLAMKSWGLSQIQQNYPGLYDFMTKGLADAKESFQVAVKNCRDYQRDIEQGDNPIDGWLKVARKSEWASASASGKNPSAVQDKIDTQAADKGVPWVGGEMRGGVGAPPIDVIGDTVSTGYEHVTGSSSGGGSEPSSGSSSSSGSNTNGGVNYQPRSIGTVFSSAEEAKTWTTAVVGERIVRTCTTCTKVEVRVGQGLRLQHVEEKTVVIENLNKLVYSDKTPTDEQLTQLSAPGMGLQVTSKLITALRDEREAERLILMDRLASEIALARSMEKALLARDLLGAGLQEPNIAANEVARSEVGDAKQRLSDEIDNILFEQRVRKEVFSQTAAAIGQRNTLRNTAGDASQALQQGSSESGIINGGVRKQ